MMPSNDAHPTTAPAPSMPPALSLDAVTKRYDDRPVLDSLFLSVPAGSVLGLLGKNGAGKTTLIKCALGLVRPNSGTVTLLGEPAHELSASAKARRQAILPLLQQVAAAARHLALTPDQVIAELKPLLEKDR